MVARIDFAIGALAAFAAVCPTTPSLAAPLTGTYDVTFAASDAFETPAPDGPIAATAGTKVFGSVAFSSGNSADFDTDLLADGTLVVSAIAQNAGNFSYPMAVTISLTSLALADNGVNSLISNVVFDAIRTDIAQFNDAANFAGPTVNFTANSITIDFGYNGQEIAADGPFLYFNVSTVPVTAVVPLPGAVWLMGSAVVALTVASQRARRPTVSDKSLT